MRQRQAEADAAAEAAAAEAEAMAEAERQQALARLAEEMEVCVCVCVCVCVYSNCHVGESGLSVAICRFAKAEQFPEHLICLHKHTCYIRTRNVYACL